MDSFEELIAKLKTQHQKGLPGEIAQFKMAPPYRSKLIKEQIQKSVPKHSAVSLFIYPNNREAHLLLIKRQDYQGVHGGQMSFPGGKRDQTDETLFQTALRETKEEIGIDLNSVTLIGELTSLYIPVSEHLVQPFLIYSFEKPVFQINSREVAEIVEIPLNLLINKTLRKSKPMGLSRNKNELVPYFDFFEYTIWGATAMILSEFIDLLDQ